MTLKKPKAKVGKKSEKKKQQQQKEVVEKWVQDVDSDGDAYAEDGQIVCLIFFSCFDNHLSGFSTGFACSNQNIHQLPANIGPSP
jgi:hypothetical protein